MKAKLKNKEFKPIEIILTLESKEELKGIFDALGSAPAGTTGVLYDLLEILMEENNDD